MKSKPHRQDKVEDVLKKIHEAIQHGRYRDTRHSMQRGIERGIQLPDILEAIGTGYHEKRKDEYREDFGNWNYAIRGKTCDGEELRVAIYFEEDRVVIVTVIRL